MAKAKIAVIESIDNDDFPFCCGLAVVGDFEASTYKRVSKRQADQDGHDVPEKGAIYQRDGDDGIYSEDEFTGSVSADQDDRLISASQALMATTVDSQVEVIAALKEAKYQAVATFVNPGTRNKVTVWFRKPTGQR